MTITLTILEANVNSWTADSDSNDTGKCLYGACCNEMDIWEANSQAAAYTPHVCTTDGQVRFP